MWKLSLLFALVFQQLFTVCSSWEPAPTGQSKAWWQWNLYFRKAMQTVWEFVLQCSDHGWVFWMWHFRSSKSWNLAKWHMTCSPANYQQLPLIGKTQLSNPNVLHMTRSHWQPRNRKTKWKLETSNFMELKSPRLRTKFSHPTETKMHKPPWKKHCNTTPPKLHPYQTPQPMTQHTNGGVYALNQMPTPTGCQTPSDAKRTNPYLQTPTAAPHAQNQ